MSGIRGAELRIERWNERTRILEAQTAEDFENYGPNAGMVTEYGNELSFEIRPNPNGDPGVIVLLHADGACVTLTAKDARALADFADRWARAASRVTDREAMLEKERAELRKDGLL